MRRADRAIALEEARSLLESAEYGVLSMASEDGVPHGIPLNFAFAEDTSTFIVLQKGGRLTSSRPTSEFLFVWLAALMCCQRSLELCMKA